MTKPAYIEAYKRGIAFCMLPKQYGGGGVTNVELILAAEEICAIDPGFACTVLVNGLALLPVWYWGTEAQKEKVLNAATSDPTGEWIAGYGASEPAGTPGGTANFDTPLPSPAGIGLTARLDGDSYVLNGRKYWPCNVGGWDGRGRTPASTWSGPTRTRAAPRDWRPSWSTEVRQGSRSTPSTPSATASPELGDHLRECPGARGEPGRGNPRQRRPPDQPQLRLVRACRRHRRRRRRAGGVRICLAWAKTYTAGGPHPIIHHQYVGYVLGDVAGKIEAARYFCWKAAHYIDQHDYHGELIGAMNKVFCTETLFDAVYKCLQVVGVNSADKKHMFEKYLREAAIFPIYDGGNFGMQRRRVHGVIASADFNARALMDDEYVEFTKQMETIDTIAAPVGS